MRYDYKKCPRCGASLDIGETCDCREELETAIIRPANVMFCKYPGRGTCEGCHHCIKSFAGYVTCDMQTEKERIETLLQSYKHKFAIPAS